MSDASYKATYERLKEDGGINHNFFSQKNTNIKKALAKKLSTYEVEVYGIKKQGDYGQALYGLHLPAGSLSNYYLQD